MGDIYGAIKFVIETLTPLVSGEVALLSGLHDDVNSIQCELQSISVFLKNAEERAEGDDAAKEWVRQVRMLAYGIEDVIERYQIFREKNAFRKAGQYVLLDVRNMASTVKSLRETSINIARTRDIYKFNDSVFEQETSMSNHKLITASSFRNTVNNEDSEHVIDDTARGEIIELLGLPRLDMISAVVAVVGMRGIGKTTIVSNVYQDKTVRSKFPLRAWISVSKSKQHDDILKSLIVKFSEATKVHNIEELSSMDESTLLSLLQSSLKEKRYLAVFDNIKGGIELAAYIKSGLPFDNEGSKIIITTRYENVAHAWLDGSTHCMYKLKPLPSDKAWELFCKKSFQSFGGRCPPPLDEIAHGIVRKCGGLPPALISVGRLLSIKADDMNEWKKVQDGLGFYLATNCHLSGIHKICMQSYYDLPFYLKPCFLYFGLFPKEHPIERMRLIRLWIAEGFIRETRGNLTLEEVAEEYIGELINMSMIEVKSTDSSGKVRSLGLINPFLHEMILSKLEELNFCKILSKNDSIGKETSRRLSIHKSHSCKALQFLRSITHIKSSIRSLLVFDVIPEVMVKVLTKAFLESIYLLKVLDLFKAPIDVIPKEVGRLLNLHYLSLRCTQVSALPSSIGKLENLQTLDLKQTSIRKLPVEIIQLRRLRHLLGYYYEHDFSSNAHCMKTNGVKVPKGLLGKSLELQKLAFLDLNVEHREWVFELRSLTQLRKLGITGLKSDEGKALCSAINGMKYLQSFNVFSNDKNESIDLGNVTNPPPMLKCLCLNGALLSFPTWINDLHALVKIRLRWSKLRVDPLETLQLLPNLVELQLLEAFVGEHMKIASNGFLKLKILHLLDLYPLKSLFIAKGALPLLTEMSIGESKNMQLPSGIKYLYNLKTLNFYNMPSEFTNQVLPNELYDSTLKHVPNGYCQTYTLRSS